MSGFFSRLKQGLARSTQKLNAALTHRHLDEAALEELEEALIAADLGPAVAGRVIDGFRKSRFGKDVTPAEIQEALAAEIARVLEPVAIPFEPDFTHKPHVCLVVGVNGVGKTTTIGKMARWFGGQGKSVVMVAGDTFRAAAVEQLQVWGERTNAPVIAGKPGADPAGLAFEGIKRAREQGADIVFIDTAGRLHNKGALMEELAKIIRVIRKFDETAPHSVLLVLDATTGQNALEQVRVFREMVSVTGLIVTKLDGSARGGIVVALAEATGLPVHLVGVGEQVEDLRAFSAAEYARGLVGDAGAIREPPAEG
ncbi:signal recognition particle-docking protein FtsY [Acidomonas methanolica]|uniref:Signal recognition particle receptor FtsY n=1 Tax=Acidomonas methanolica NBRC 104435 TaxID=1231351 RepID=A0A023D2Y1_ACIMT|nr:signal recognition particle-docking protein FtsY [Acidomonas methanolica]MBU2654745.1 signal recognition particle-docking protein FtsY [Acidomonas methanolica]MCQ9156537.1 signal recognition particle-docking protein FtsY [Acidomonas methanolica]TCS26399.1 fused signal recognition particle receptor [Acidomonas methanolica]GAJ28528.1 cell division protein FtsY [Acidomonas methanolica NBRC 104435]GBQ56754.1 cell division protein FtsY [Acidomonas methanolica]